MNGRRWMLCAGLIGLLLACAGCLSDDVVYVDEHGNELAVDENGKPILPGQAGSGAEQAPQVATSAPEWPVSPPTDVAPAPRSRPAHVSSKPTAAPAARTKGGPAPDPSWDLSSAKPHHQQPPSSTPPKPAKPVDSSDALDSPPGK